MVHFTDGAGNMARINTGVTREPGLGIDVLSGGKRFTRNVSRLGGDDIKMYGRVLCVLDTLVLGSMYIYPF